MFKVLRFFAFDSHRAREVQEEKISSKQRNLLSTTATFYCE